MVTQQKICGSLKICANNDSNTDNDVFPDGGEGIRGGGKKPNKLFSAVCWWNRTT